MIVIATHNGKEHLKKLLSNLESFKLDKEISIIDTMSSNKESLDFLDEISTKNIYNLNINIYKTEYRGFDTGAYIYAINNLIAERFYFLQDSIIIKDRELFDITDDGQKLTTKK
jgi:GT2 family glycosyltransferase